MAEKLAVAQFGRVADLEKRGWFVGHFMESSSWAASDAFEVKWGTHAKGEQKSGGYAANDIAKTVSVIVRGTMRYFWIEDGVERTVDVAGEGSYFYLPPGVPHKWEAVTDMVVISFRWPSLPGDQKVVK